jgi:hypothetical protein
MNRRIGLATLAAGLSLGAGVAAGLFTLRDMRLQADEARVDVAVIIAAQTDRVLGEAFFELEQIAVASFDFATGDVRAPINGLTRGFSSTVFVFDSEGEVAAALGDPPISAGLARFPEIVEAATTAGTRTVSEPFRSDVTESAFTALGVPVFGSAGNRLGSVVGFMDLVDPVVFDLVRSAMLLGPTGHADLIDSRGLVLVSTDPSHALTEGDHPEFYVRAGSADHPMVERVPHTPSGTEMDTSQFHVMAYAQVQMAPWGVAVGESEGATYRAVGIARARLVALGAASLVGLIAALILVVRLGPMTKHD